ncbi:hypothetical protein ABVT39_006103 [Epinephelus coioides]
MRNGAPLRSDALGCHSAHFVSIHSKTRVQQIFLSHRDMDVFGHPQQPVTTTRRRVLRAASREQHQQQQQQKKKPCLMNQHQPSWKPPCSILHDPTIHLPASIHPLTAHPHFCFDSLNVSPTSPGEELPECRCATNKKKRKRRRRRTGRCASERTEERFHSGVSETREPPHTENFFIYRGGSKPEGRGQGGGGGANDTP